MSRIAIRRFFLPVAITASLLVPPCRAFSLSEWLSKDPYEDGGTVQEQIQCYALPYGAIGMASHILTYFTAYMLSRGRNPIFVWQRLKHRRFNLSVAAVGFVITLVLTSLTMARCRRTWPFILVGVWKLVLSVTLTGMTVQAALETFDEPKKKKKKTKVGRYHRVWYWVPLYVLGVAVGFVGIMNIVSKHIMGNQQLRIITGVFGGVVLLIVLAVVVLSWLMMSGSGGCVGIVGISCLAATGVAVFALSVLFAFYTDWVLAALAEDLVGIPSQDNAVFYWTYFAAKRLPMVSF
ncbi:hypothetical protein B0T21DRAFT_281722 [Apiosordaria backusii]|uniref:Uncharacterized protein n=1 Tax=Apiosordaria backusii TaxID=314023 RepID=A0AA40K3J7_9PEZI|nr:hypothetical protein B0T21DRAFT_281722 [Apiosordaria backusii]